MLRMRRRAYPEFPFHPNSVVQIANCVISMSNSTNAVRKCRDTRDFALLLAEELVPESYATSVHNDRQRTYAGLSASCCISWDSIRNDWTYQDESSSKSTSANPSTPSSLCTKQQSCAPPAWINSSHASTLSLFLAGSAAALDIHPGPMRAAS